MRSGSPSRMAAGAVLARTASARTDADEDEPRPEGITTTRPVSDAPRCG